MLKNFFERPDVLKHIDEADKLKSRDAIKEYGKRNKVWSHPTFQGYYESTEHVKPETYDGYRSKAAKQASITREWNYATGKREEFSEEPKTGKIPPKVKKALKVAGGVGALGVLGAGTAIAGDALNLWDLGEVGGVAGKVLSPLDKAGNALNAMASAPTVKELNKVKGSLKQAENKYQDLVDEVTKVGLSYGQGNEIHIHPKAYTQNGGVGVHISTHDPYPVNLDLESTIPMDVCRKLIPTSRSYK